MCFEIRKKEYIFENGTHVFARDYQSAIVKLHETNDSQFTIEDCKNYNWKCTFSPTVFVEYKSSSGSTAALHGPWFLHLDKRVTVSQIPNKSSWM